jgi:DNA-binding MarR family transcriptional regulator
LQSTTPSHRSSFPDDDLRRLLLHLVRFGGLLEPHPAPHDHGGVRVSTTEVFALGALAEAETMSQQDLADHLGLEKSTVSRLAAGLQARGWLARERDPANRRFYRLRLTAEGEDAARRVGQHLHDHHTQLLGLLTEQERAGLAIGLGGLIRAMEHHHRPGSDGSPPQPA